MDVFNDDHELFNFLLLFSDPTIFESYLTLGEIQFCDYSFVVCFTDYIFTSLFHFKTKFLILNSFQSDLFTEPNNFLLISIDLFVLSI